MNKITKNPQSYFAITLNEMADMSGLPYFYQLLYFYLRSKTDRTSGLVGSEKGKKISLQAIREWLYVEPSQGIKDSGSPSIKKIRIALQALERIGLIESRSIVTKHQKQLILFLPYAKQDYSVQNKVGMFGAQKLGTEQGIDKSTKSPINTSSLTQLNNNHNMDEGLCESSKVGAPHNNIYKYTHTTTACFKKSIIANYQPSAEIMKKAEELELIKFHSELELQKFISYYKSNEIQAADWDHKYLGWLINAKQFQQQNGDAQHAKRRQRSYPTARKTLSAVDEVRKRNQLLSKNAIIEAEIDNEGRYFPSVGRTDPSLWS